MNPATITARITALDAAGLFKRKRANMKAHKTESRRRCLAALFSKAAKAGLTQDQLREDLAPGLLGKRLSEATAQEILRVVEYIAGLYGLSSPLKKGKKYDPSRAGLLEELEDAARERWGGEYVKSLNAFVNHNRPQPTHYRFLKVADLKAIKRRILELNQGARDDGA